MTPMKMPFRAQIERLPLRYKLTAIIFFTSFTVSVLGMGVYMTNNIAALRARLQQDAELIATTVAGYSAVDLAFEDKDAANASLAGLANAPNLVNAFLFDKYGKLFVSLQPQPRAPAAPTVNTTFMELRDDFLHVVRPVRFQDVDHGSLYVLFSLEPLKQRERAAWLTFAAMSGSALVLSLLLAIWLQRFVSAPIQALAAAANRVSRDKDYDVRVQPARKDEIGDLNRAFNAMLGQIKEREAALEGANRALRAVGACSAAMVHANTEAELLENVCRAIVEKAGYRLAWVGWAQHDPERRVRPVAEFGFDEGYLARAGITWADEPRGQGPTGTAIRTGEPAVARHILTDNNFAPWREAALQRGYASSLALPLTTGNVTLGALNIYSTRPDAFDGSELELLNGLAQDLMFGLSALRTRAERDQALLVLSRRTAEFEAMFKAIPDAATFADPDRRIVMCNPAVSAMFGYSDDEIIGDTTLKLYADPQDFAIQGRVRFHAGGRVPTAPYEMRYRRKDGSVFWSETVAARVVDSEGELLGFIAIIRDISERKGAEETIRQLNAELEQRVRERTAELEAANQELESFSYSVSHDLRAPLRAIDGFSQVLEEDYASQLDDSARGYLQRVRLATQRMGLLIDDLLNLSRVSRAPIRHENVDLSVMGREIVEELQESEPDRKVEVVIAPDLKTVGDSILLRAVMYNLLANAWKYTRRTARARIELGSTRERDVDCFFVRDNGAGFDMEYASKLFAPFQRLHRQQDFEGTGIGLATVQRILHRHGGSIWVNAEVDRGATFYFTVS